MSTFEITPAYADPWSSLKMVCSPGAGETAVVVGAVHNARVSLGLTVRDVQPFKTVSCALSATAVAGARRARADANPMFGVHAVYAEHGNGKGEGGRPEQNHCVR